jgi:hypothetical protein
MDTDPYNTIAELRKVIVNQEERMKQFEVELRHAIHQLDTVRTNYQNAMTSMGTELELAYAQIRSQRKPNTVIDTSGGTLLRGLLSGKLTG